MKLLFTGGGSAGHVTPNLALIESFTALGDTCLYVGSADGIEARLVTSVPFHTIASGKLRRYFSWQNFVDPFKIAFGLLQALLICLREKPDIVFSKGGFVAVPVVYAAWLCRIPVICHESDVTPGLANRLCLPVIRRICLNFEETLRYVPNDRAVVTGTPLRSELTQGDAARGRAFLGFDTTRPVLLVFGGSLGAQAINTLVWRNLAALTEEFQVCHVVGDGQVNASADAPGYVQKPYIREEFGDVLMAADIVVSRAGANALYELLSLQRPHLLIPLTAVASRGDQLANARTFRDAGYSRVLEEQDATDEAFLESLWLLWRDREDVAAALAKFRRHDSVATITHLLRETAGNT